MIETLANGCSSERTQRELSNKYLFELWNKVASALDRVKLHPQKPNSGKQTVATAETKPVVFAGTVPSC